MEIQKRMQKQNVYLNFNPSLPEGSKRRLLDNSKICKLGWKPKYTLIQSLSEIINDIIMRETK